MCTSRQLYSITHDMVQEYRRVYGSAVEKYFYMDPMHETNRIMNQTWISLQSYMGNEMTCRNC